MFKNLFVRSNLEFIRFLSVSLRQDMTNSSLSVLVYKEKDDFSSKTLLVNQAQLSGLVSVMTMCRDFKADCKNGSNCQFQLYIYLYGRMTADTSFSRKDDWLPSNKLNQSLGCLFFPQRFRLFLYF